MHGIINANFEKGTEFSFKLSQKYTIFNRGYIDQNLKTFFIINIFNKHDNFFLNGL